MLPPAVTHVGNFTVELECLQFIYSTHMLICFQGYGSDGLKLLSHEESISFGESVLKLTFDPGTVEDGLLTVECKLDHPFYVKNKGRALIVFVQTSLLFSCVWFFACLDIQSHGTRFQMAKNCQLHPRSLGEQALILTFPEFINALKRLPTPVLWL